MTEKWDRFFLNLAKQVSTQSKDPSTKCGVVIVNDLKQVVGMGYNGFPRGVDDDQSRYANRELKYKMVVHAEVNAIIQAGHSARGCTLYSYPSFSMPPICHDCAKVAIQAGIKEVVGFTPSPEDAARGKRWGESLSLARRMFLEAGVDWRHVEP